MVAEIATEASPLIESDSVNVVVGKVDFKDEFDWRLRIIHDDSTLNAFCTPGGYIYIYTGILKFLDSEDEFAGVLAHEIGHADMRHSTRQMTKLFGVQLLLDVLSLFYFTVSWPITTSTDLLSHLHCLLLANRH